FIAVYAAAAVIFFASPAVMGDGGLPGIIVNRQEHFLNLEGTRFQRPRLQPTFQSFITALPTAIGNSFFRPAPWEAKNIFQLFSSLDILLFLTSILYVLFNKRDDWKARLTDPV